MSFEHVIWEIPDSELLSIFLVEAVWRTVIILCRDRSLPQIFSKSNLPHDISCDGWMNKLMDRRQYFLKMKWNPRWNRKWWWILSLTSLANTFNLSILTAAVLWRGPSFLFRTAHAGLPLPSSPHPSFRLVGPWRWWAQRFWLVRA